MPLYNCVQDSSANCIFIKSFFNSLYPGNPLRGTSANSEGPGEMPQNVDSADPNEMPHYALFAKATFHQGLHCLLFRD